MYTCVTGVSLLALRRPRDFTLHTYIPKGNVVLLYSIYHDRYASGAGIDATSQ